MLRVVSWAGVVQVRPQAMKGEALGPAQLSLMPMFAFSLILEDLHMHDPRLPENRILRNASGIMQHTGSLDGYLDHVFASNAVHADRLETHSSGTTEHSLGLWQNWNGHCLHRTEHVSGCSSCKAQRYRS